MKAMVIGISPNYNYPGTFEKWGEDNTYYASNQGASLIVRSIMKEFDADYVDDFSDISQLKNKYDTCFLGLATHAHSERDISKLVDVVEKLEMKTVVLSLGVSDYMKNISGFYKLHNSVIRLLNIASEGTSWIGVRGPHTAYVLNQNGFKNVVPTGCPTTYSNLSPDFKINTKETYQKPLFVYHRTIVENNPNILDNVTVLGQDYEDEAFFTNHLEHDAKLQRIIASYYNHLSVPKNIVDDVKNKGVFTNDYAEWINIIKKHDFAFGPRLHGCMSSLLQGIPAVLTPRDLRVKEIADFYDLPNIPYNQLKHYKIEDVFAKADFSKFQETYKLRYNNFVSFIKENKLDTKLAVDESKDYKFSYSVSDIQTFNYITYNQIKPLNISQYKKERSKRFFSFEYYKKNSKFLIKKYLK